MTSLDIVSTESPGDEFKELLNENLEDEAIEASVKKR